MVWTLPPRKLPMPQPQPQRYTICDIAGAENCWQVGGKRPEPREVMRVHICSSGLYCWWHPSPPPNWPADYAAKYDSWLDKLDK